MEGKVIAMARRKAAKSLDEYRSERYMSVTEFMAFLGVASHTYYSALNRQGVRPTTMRRIAEKLGVHPSEIAEFVPKDYEPPRPPGPHPG
jgi:DNA-binding Xre family transcriptional regulator